MTDGPPPAAGRIRNGDETVKPITFPAPELDPGLRAKARWLNFFNPNDVLGYALSPIGPEYAAVVPAVRRRRTPC